MFIFAGRGVQVCAPYSPPGTHPWTGGILPWIGGIFRGEYSIIYADGINEQNKDASAGVEIHPSHAQWEFIRIRRLARLPCQVAHCFLRQITNWNMFGAPKTISFLNSVSRIFVSKKHWKHYVFQCFLIFYTFIFVVQRFDFQRK